jgi:4-hydroxythreonine-4-phosphate dehydrogenase
VLDAIVTAPINKHNIQNEEFPYPGHTEYFAYEFAAQETVMLLVSGDLRVGVVTGHIPLSAGSRRPSPRKKSSARSTR